MLSRGTCTSRATLVPHLIFFAPARPPPQLVAPSDVEAKFRALEGSDVDDDLAKMKAALGSGKPKGEVRGAGWPRGGALLCCGRPPSLGAPAPGGGGDGARRAGRSWRTGCLPGLPAGCLPTGRPAMSTRPCPPPQLPPGRPLNEAIDYELQDLKKRMGN